MGLESATSTWMAWVELGVGTAERSTGELGFIVPSCPKDHGPAVCPITPIW